MGDYASKEKLRAIFADMASKINLNTSGAGVAGGYTPIGTIIAYMGKTAPEDHLPCDGSLHQIAKYPQLADFFHEQFGKADIFGGNGITSFAMPDFSGEDSLPDTIWCIKALDTKPSTFKEDETMIGRWLNVPQYQKVIRLSSPVTLTANDWTTVLNPLSSRISSITEVISAKQIGNSVMYFETQADTTNDVLKVFNPTEEARTIKTLALEYIKAVIL